ncbi:MAG TPA: hypothetical protein VIJ79_05255 [Acidobacteriaceae bacterium]
MKALVLFLLCLPLYAQSPDAVKYAPRAVLLLSGVKGEEGVMPMSFTENGQTRWEYVPASKIQESISKGGRPLHMGEVLAALNEATQRINQLQAENDKLWKVAMKSDSVVVQSVTPSGPSQAEIAAQQQAQEQAQANARRALALQMLLGMRQSQPQPYQLPMPVNPNANRLQTTCTTYRLGELSHTVCN